MSWWRALGPAMARPGKVDMLRSGIGAGLGLLVAALAVHLAEDSRLIAPLGASAVMVFVLPNSPLAQPWSVVVGNCAATLAAILLVALLPAAPWVGPVVVAAGLLAMHALRALHPPGGAAAFMVALGGGGEPIMVLAVAALGSVVLVATAMVWHRATGRVYPFRQPSQPGRHGTRDPAAEERIGVDPEDLERILEEFRQSANLGVADLARLVAAVEQAAAARRMQAFTAADIMSRDLVTVGPDAPLSRVADLFRTRGFTSLPVVGPEGILGLIFQIDLIRHLREDSYRKERPIFSALYRVIGDRRLLPQRAHEIMQKDFPSITPDTPIGRLLPLLADGGPEAVPVVEGPALVGIVTRTDLVSALAQRLAVTGD